MLVNNWTEAFNIVIMKARDQPVIAMLSTIHNVMMGRLKKEAKRVQKWQGDVSPRIANLIKFRSSKVSDYITTFNGQHQYGVSTAHHAWVVEPDVRICSCGLWQLSGVPCIHAVCVYMAQSKDPIRYVDDIYNKATQKRIYSHFLAHIRGPTFWTLQPNLPEIIPPEIRVLPGRPKKCRNIGESEKRDIKEKEAARKEKSRRSTQEHTAVFKASRKGIKKRCSICHADTHNARTCPTKKQQGASVNQS